MLPDRRDSEYQEDGLLFLLSSLLLFSTTKPRLCCLTGFVNGLPPPLECGGAEKAVDSVYMAWTAMDALAFVNTHQG